MAQLSRKISKKISKGISKGVFGAVALSMTFAAVAWGRDLVQQGGPGQLVSADASASSINRSGKTDRAARIAGPTPQTQTISLRLNGLSDTSILIRVPAANEARNGSSAPLLKSNGGKMADACEPSVSVLTEIAKRLAPGRCVT